MSQPDSRGNDPFERDPHVSRNDDPPARYPEWGSDDDADWTPPRPPDLLGRGAAPAPAGSAATPVPPPPSEPIPPPPPPSARPLRGLSPVGDAEVRGIEGTLPHRGTLLLVLGIAGLLVCQLLCPVVWILASNDLGEIKRGRIDPEGRGLTQAGLALGMVGTVLLLAPFVLFLLFGLVALPAGVLSGL
ncbi:MAG: hypothetical protein GC161_10585 [Planctomycetaceae bacterium]|nr:hypothetical protein [Planctomycetaceae bacterium]